MRKLFFILLATGCRSTADDVTGTYVRSSVNAFGTEYDTLQVHRPDAARDEFLLTRRWQYVRKDDTVYHVQRSFARFYPFDRKLRDAIRGKDYIIDVRKGTITDGNVIYTR